MSFVQERIGECEGAKVAAIAARYLQGKALDIGSGPGKVWPSVLGVDPDADTDLRIDGTDLSMFADCSMDAVFSSFLLHMVEPSKVKATLSEWARVLKVGGYLTLYLPDFSKIPIGADFEHRWKPTAASVSGVIANLGCWTVIEDEVRDGGNEFGLFLVFRKDADRDDRALVRDAWERNPGGRKRALVVRLGAIGDSFLAASVFPHLREQGYHVSLSCNPGTHEVLEHDPFVEDFLIQGKDFVPNNMLGPFWEALSERYDHVVNLSESVEGVLLAMPGRLNHAYSDEARRRIIGPVNYLERTHDIAGVPHDFSNARFHATEFEQKWAKATRKNMDGPVVVWCVNGSSPHKVYPFTQVVAKWLIERTSAHLVLYGDPGVGKALQDGIMECLRTDGVPMSRIHGIAGKWSIRQSLAFLETVDCVVGPETGPMNAAGMLDVPKVCYLSHSSAANLTKHWRNTITLLPSSPCFPCHRLHMDWSFCFRDEKTAAAACASSIKPEMVFKAIAQSLLGEVEVPGGLSSAHG